jgi:hypothetical protein
MDTDRQIRSKKVPGALTASREQFTDSNRNNRGSCKITMYLSYEPQAKIDRLESLIDDRPPLYQPQHHSHKALLNHVPLAVSAICAALKTLDEYTSNYPQCPESISAGRTSILTAAGLDSTKKATKPTFLQCREIAGLHSASIHPAYRLSWRIFQSEILRIV